LHRRTDDDEVHRGNRNLTASHRELTEIDGRHRWLDAWGAAAVQAKRQVAGLEEPAGERVDGATCLVDERKKACIRGLGHGHAFIAEIGHARVHVTPSSSGPWPTRCSCSEGLRS